MRSRIKKRKIGKRTMKREMRKAKLKAFSTDTSLTETYVQVYTEVGFTMIFLQKSKLLSTG